MLSICGINKSRKETPISYLILLKRVARQHKLIFKGSSIQGSHLLDTSELRSPAEIRLF